MSSYVLGGMVITNPVLPWARGRFVPPSATPHTLFDLAASLTAVARTGAEAALARNLAARTGCPSVHLTASGRAAFFLILTACRALRPERREVTLPAYTCPVLANAASAAGLHVRLVDMDPLTLDYDRAALARAIGPQTLAVVSAHLLGLPRPLHDLHACAQAAGAFLVDDAAQALGARSPESAACTGAQGDAGLYSFGPGKPLSAGGGGAALFSHPALAMAAAEIFAAWPAPRLAARLLAWGRMAGLAAAFHPRGWWGVMRLGLDAAGDDPRTWAFARQRLSAPAAALADRLLPRLDGWNSQRRGHAQRLLADLPAQVGLTPIAAAAGSQPIYLRLPLLARNQAQRAELIARLRRAGIGAGRLYGHTLAEILRGPLRAGLPGPGAVNLDDDFPGATEIAQRLLTLPTHPYVQERDIEAMLAVLGAAQP